MDQTIGYCTSPDGTRIAYAVSGSGPVLVRAATFATHIGLDVDSVLWGHWWRDLSREHTLVRYDSRGVGLSQRGVAFSNNPENAIADLEAVLEALKLESFDLLGHSLGAKTAARFAANNPLRVDRLVLVNGTVEATLLNHLSGHGKKIARDRREMIFQSWESEAVRRLYASWLVPDSTADELEATGKFLRESVDVAAARDMARPSLDWRLVNELGKVKTPTLVLHSNGNELLPPGSGRLIADSIVNSKLVELNSRSHILSESEPAWPEFLRHVEEFLGREHSAGRPRPLDQDAAVALGLTRREAQVLALICEGATDREIAEALGIETPTATNHVRSLQQKTGTKNRAHAVTWAARRHLL